MVQWNRRLSYEGVKNIFKYIYSKKISHCIYMYLVVSTHFSLYKGEVIILVSFLPLSPKWALLFTLWENAPTLFLTDRGKWGGPDIDSLPYVHVKTGRTCNIKHHTTFLHRPWWCQRGKKPLKTTSTNCYDAKSEVLGPYVIKGMHINT